MHRPAANLDARLHAALEHELSAHIAVNRHRLRRHDAVDRLRHRDREQTAGTKRQKRQRRQSDGSSGQHFGLPGFGLPLVLGLLAMS